MATIALGVPEGAFVESAAEVSQQPVALDSAAFAAPDFRSTFLEQRGDASHVLGVPSAPPIPDGSGVLVLASNNSAETAQRAVVGGTEGAVPSSDTPISGEQVVEQAGRVVRGFTEPVGTPGRRESAGTR